MSPEQQRAALANGWKLVPPHATPEMLAAFFAEDFTQNGYVQMLLAAPPPASLPAAEPNDGLRVLMDRNEWRAAMIGLCTAPDSTVATPELAAAHLRRRLARASLPAEPARDEPASLPVELFDTFAVHDEIPVAWQARTSPENVADTLDAVARMIRKRLAAQPTEAPSLPAGVVQGDERASFEAWALSDDGGWWPDAVVRNGDYYKAPAVTKQWTGWQARAALAKGGAA